MPPKNNELQWLRIEDFTPGIHSDTGAAATNAAVPWTGYATGGVANFPRGSADVYSTYNCIARPTGGLGPLPAMTQAFVYPNAIPFVVTVNMLTVHELTGNLTQEALIGLEYDNPSGSPIGGFPANSHFYSVTSINPTTPPVVGNNIPPISITAAVVTGGIYVQFTIASGTPPPVGSYIQLGGTVSGGTWASILTAQDENLGTNAIPGLFQVVGATGLTFRVQPITAPSGTATNINLNFFNVVATVPGASNEPTGVAQYAGNPLVFGAPYPNYTRVADTLYPPTTTPGTPVIAWPWAPSSSVAASFFGHVFVYPNPGIVGSTTSQPGNAADIIQTPPAYASMGQLLTHQNRIICLSYTEFFFGAQNYLAYNNEQLNFTDPPNGSVYVNELTFFGVEQPFGYGAAGSISAGELLLIKRRGGGLVVSGDVVNPTVTVFPGVQSTGNMYGRAAQGIMGLVYCSYAQGAYVWNGGNTSSKISQALDNNFFIVPLPTGATGGAYSLNAGDGSSNYGFYCEAVADKVYFSNNYVFDTTTGGFWTYFPRPGQDPNHTGYNLFWYENVDNDYAYAAPLQFSGTGSGVGTPDQTCLFQFRSSQLASYWSWKSNPIHIAENRMVESREVVVRLSALGSISNVGAPQAVIKVFASGVLVGQVTTPPGAITNVPNDIRMPIGPGQVAQGNAYADHDITVQVYAFNPTGGAAPFMHHIDIGYRERQHIPTTGVTS